MNIFILEELISDQPSLSIIKGAFMTRELAEKKQAQLTRGSWIIEIPLENGTGLEELSMREGGK